MCGLTGTLLFSALIPLEQQRNPSANRFWVEATRHGAVCLSDWPSGGGGGGAVTHVVSHQQVAPRPRTGSEGAEVAQTAQTRGSNALTPICSSAPLLLCS